MVLRSGQVRGLEEGPNDGTVGPRIILQVAAPASLVCCKGGSGKANTAPGPPLARADRWGSTWRRCGFFGCVHEVHLRIACCKSSLQCKTVNLLPHVTMGARIHAPETQIATSVCCVFNQRTNCQGLQPVPTSSKSEARVGAEVVPQRNFQKFP